MCEDGRHEMRRMTCGPWYGVMNNENEAISKPNEGRPVKTEVKQWGENVWRRRGEVKLKTIMKSWPETLIVTEWWLILTLLFLVAVGGLWEGWQLTGGKPLVTSDLWRGWWLLSRRKLLLLCVFIDQCVMTSWPRQKRALCWWLEVTDLTGRLPEGGLGNSGGRGGRLEEPLSGDLVS